MNLLMALLRSAYLAFVVGYTLAVSPLESLWSGTVAVPGAAVPVPIVAKVFIAAWLAIGWIALEVVVAWVRVWLDARSRRRAASAPVAPLPPP
jgi:hypothetical protein